MFPKNETIYPLGTGAITSFAMFIANGSQLCDLAIVSRLDADISVSRLDADISLSRSTISLQRSRRDRLQ